MSQPPQAVTAGTLRLPDASLHYEVRGTGPLLLLVGAPMDAAAFARAADLLATDHTVLTTDPRGINRSSVADRDRDSTPEQRAQDLSRLIAHIDAGPAVVFGSSGGAVTALALLQAHPDQVRLAVAHEPPVDDLLPDRSEVRARTDAMVAAHRAGDVVGAWAGFFANADIELPPGALEEMFGGEREPQVVADERFWFAHELTPSVRWTPDYDVLRAHAARLVIGVGVESTGPFCDRTTQALAAALGLDRTVFPGGHIGFVDDPVTFAAALRALLRGD